MKECDHIIGWFKETFNGPDSWPMHLNRDDVGDMNSGHAEDGYRFRFCPLCGRSIDWDNMEELLRLREL